MQKRQHSGFYHSLVIIPDRLYPFKTEVRGQWVRGIRAYNETLERYQRAYGVGRYGYKLMVYRQAFHFVGSILFLIIAAYLSQSFFESTKAIYAFLIAAVLLISFQEFYVHRRMYQQLWRKGIVDWLAWCVPIGIYFFSLFR